MGIGGPPVAPSVRSWLGVGREMQMGTAVLPTNTLPVDMKSYAPEDTPKFLPDEALRGVMGGLFNMVLGPEDATFSFGGPNFLDIHGFMLDNLFGDLSTTGSSPASGTNLGGSVATLAIGGTQATLVSASGYGSGSTVQIDSGSVAEVVVLSAAPSGSLITFGNYPLRFPHNSGATVSIVSSPYVHKLALLNSALGYGGVAGAQPPTHTLTDNTNLNYSGTPGTNTSGARAYPSACVSSMTFSGNSTALLDVKFSGNSFVSQPAGTTPTNVVSSVVPVANWRGQIYIGGTSAANLVTDIGEWSLDLKRALEVYWTVQGNENPEIIARGPVTTTLSMNFTTPPDETPLSYLLYQGYQYVHIVLSSPGSGGTVVSFTLDAHTCQDTKTKPNRSKTLVGFDSTWEMIYNSTDVGGSGGLGPCTITLQNAIPSY